MLRLKTAVSFTTEHARPVMPKQIRFRLRGRWEATCQVNDAITHAAIFPFVHSILVELRLSRVVSTAHGIGWGQVT